jgi:hypothetical protein
VPAPPLHVALALAATAWPEHGRLVLSATAGGGFVSDFYAGAGMGPAGMGQVIPGARLDLSLAPRLKLSIAGDAALTRFGAARFHAPLDARIGSATAEGRWLGGAGEVSLAAGAERTGFSAPAPAGDLAGGPDVIGSTAARITAGARIRRGALAARALVGGTWRTSRIAGARPDAEARALALVAAGAWAPHPRLALDLAARHERTESRDARFAALTWGGSADALASPLAGTLQAGAHVHVERSRLDGGATETAARVALDLGHPIGPVTALLAWSWTRTSVSARADEPARPPGSRHLVFLGLRGQAKALDW